MKAQEAAAIGFFTSLQKNMGTKFMALEGERIDDIVFWGGSCDPPTLAHVAIIKNLLKRFRTVVVAITAHNPDKKHAPASLEHRRNMMRLLLRASGVSVADTFRQTGAYLVEFDYCYVDEFVKHWSEYFGPREFVWAVGPDVANTVQNWRGGIAEQLTFVVHPNIDGIRSSLVREGTIDPEPCIWRYIWVHELYRGTPLGKLYQGD